jgi:uncharacterized protein (TIGR02118 family)
MPSHYTRAGTAARHEAGAKDLRGNLRAITRGMNMVKFVVVLFRRPGMTREDFSAYLRMAHGDLARRLPGMKRYVQNHVAQDSKRKPPAWDAVVELHWENREAMEAAWASPEGAAATADLEAFADLSRSSWSIVEEVVGIEWVMWLRAATFFASRLESWESCRESKPRPSHLDQA